MSSYQCNEYLKKVTAASFALDDMRLYLDTHPFDKEAIAFYEKYIAIRKEAIAEYEKNIGPVCSYDVKGKNGTCCCENDQWAWVNEPWPWEGVD